MIFKNILKCLYVSSLAILLVCQSANATISNSGLAVVLIDMQDGFYKRGGTTDSQGLHDLVYNQIKLLKWAVQKHIPVLVFQYVRYGDTDPRLMKVIANSKYKIIEKNTDGGFYGKSRAEAIALMKEWKVDTLIVAGVNGPYCVRDTIMSALELGFDVMTTSWVIGNINHNPPTFPNGSWYFKNSKFVVFPTLEAIIR